MCLNVLKPATALAILNLGASPLPFLSNCNPNSPAMTALESTPVKIEFFAPGSVEEVAQVEHAENLAAATESVRARFAGAAFVRCCEHEADGGCVFVYPSADDLAQDEADAAAARPTGNMPAGYGRWVGLISAAATEEPRCERPARHGGELRRPLLLRGRPAGNELPQLGDLALGGQLERPHLILRHERLNAVPIDQRQVVVLGVFGMGD